MICGNLRYLRSNLRAGCSFGTLMAQITLIFADFLKVGGEAKFDLRESGYPRYLRSILGEARLVANTTKRTTVIELSGIKIAATNGDNRPFTANHNPTLL